MKIFYLFINNLYLFFCELFVQVHRVMAFWRDDWSRVPVGVGSLSLEASEEPPGKAQGSFREVHVVVWGG